MLNLKMNDNPQDLKLRTKAFALRVIHMCLKLYRPKMGGQDAQDLQDFKL